MKKIALMTMLILLAAAVLTVDAPAEKKRRTVDKTVEDEIAVKKGEELDLDIDTGGDIYVTSWDEDKVLVEVAIRGRDWENVEVDIDDTRSGVRVDVFFDKKLRRNRVDTKLFIKVPKEFDIHFSTMGGDVEMEGIEGRFTGKTMGGDMKFVDLRGILKVTTMGGDIRVSDSELDGNVKTFGGDVTINDVVGDLKGSTFGGDVTYDGVKKGSKKSKRGRKYKGDDDDDEVSVSTLGGDLDLDYEGKEVNAKTLGGDINVGKAKKVKVMTMGGDIEVEEAPEGADVHTMGGDITIEEAGKFIKAKTMGGDIEIREIDGKIKATTMGGDVIVRMVGDPDEGDREVELSSMGGNIELSLPEGLSIEFDVEIAYTKKYEGKCRLVCDFPIEIEETKEWKRKWGQKRKYIYGTGEYNGGKHRIKIRTINGDVHITKN